jgi:hypothetical protein
METCDILNLATVLESAQQVATELPNDPDVAGFATLVGQANRIASNQ